MSQIEDKVAGHYSHGALGEAIRAGLAALATTSKAEPIDLLAAVDEFHMGGRQATKTLAEALDIDPGHHVLDIGCGLGGTARFLASTYGCKVTGIDLTAEYVTVGNELNDEVGLAPQIDLTVANATDLPFANARFDRASLLHVGMNIADKEKLFQEAARVIKAGGYLGVYDVMRTNDLPITFPVAWAENETTSFVEPVDIYRAKLEAAGFRIVDIANRSDVALYFFEAIKKRLAEGGPPPLGLHIVMGSDARLKVSNMHVNVETGTISPVQILAQRL